MQRVWWCLTGWHRRAGRAHGLSSRPNGDTCLAPVPAVHVGEQRRHVCRRHRPGRIVQEVGARIVHCLCYLFGHLPGRRNDGACGARPARPRKSRARSWPRRLFRESIPIRPRRTCWCSECTGPQGGDVAAERSIILCEGMVRNHMQRAWKRDGLATRSGAAPQHRCSQTVQPGLRDRRGGH